MTTKIRLRGLSRRRGVFGSVLALNGCSTTELRRAVALAARLSDSYMIVAVDGGVRTCRSIRRKPQLFVGDADSAGCVPRDIPSVVFSRDKEFSDLSAALVEVRGRHVDLVVVAGLLGGRLDHEWANLFELGVHARKFAGMIAPADRGNVLVTAGGCRAETEPDRDLSLFALGGSAVVSLRGTRWKLDRERIRPGSRGLSNVTGKMLDLKIHSGVVAVVFPNP